MRVVFNTLATLKAKTGVGHYSARLAEVMSRQLGPGQFTKFPNEAVGRLVPQSTDRRSVAQGAAKRAMLSAAKSLGRQAVGSWFYAAHSSARYDLYHEPNFLPLPSRLPTIITVHDLSVLLHPQWHPADRVRRHESAFRRAVADAARIITVSEAVRQEVMTHLSVAPDLVHAVPNGVGPEFFADRDVVSLRQRLHLPDQYLLYVGTIEPRKNLMMLLKAWCDLPSEVRERCPLLLAGGWGWKAEDIAAYYDVTARHRNVRHLGYIQDADRPALMAGARAMVFPSHYEGFGLPPLEMLATGGAVLASKAAAHREVLGNHAHFIAADDIAGWRDALNIAATDNDWLHGLRRGNREHAAHFSWERTANMTVAVYDAAISRRLAA